MVKKSPKQGATVEDATVNMSLKSYLDNQERTVSALNVYHRIANAQLQASSQQLSAINANLESVQGLTKAALSGAGFTEDSPGVEAYISLYELLKKEKSAISNPFGETSALAMPNGIKAAPAASPELVDGKAKKAKKPKKIKDPNAPNRPVTAYFMFSAKYRPILKEELGPDVKPGDIQKKLQENWAALSEAEQEEWKAQYRQDWAKHQVEVEKYKENGGQVSALDLQPPDEDAEEGDLEDDAPAAVAAVETDDSSSSESEDESESESEATPPPPPPPKAKASATKPKAAAAKPVKVSKATQAAAAKAAAAEPARAPSPIRSSTERSPEAPKKVVKETAAAKKKRIAAEAAAEAEAEAQAIAAASSSPEVSKKRKSKDDSPEVSKKAKVKGTPTITEAEKSARKKKRESQFGTDF